MSKVIKVVVGVGLVAVGIITRNPALIFSGLSTLSGSLLGPGRGSAKRAATAATVQIGEVPRQAVLGRAAVAGSLVDAFNYGGKYGTDWEVLVLALADHRCDALESVFINDTLVAFAGDGAVAGFNGQLEIYWRAGSELQTTPALLTAHGPGWTANDRGVGVCYAVVAYKADAGDAKNPVWPGGRPRFRFVLRGLLCYDPRLDSSVGGLGAQRWDDPATRVWSENPIVCRYTWARGIHAADRVSQPDQLLVGRGLSAIEAPPANAFARANLCDEQVGGAARYRVGGLISAAEQHVEVENDIAAACAGVIVQPEGAVEIDPGEARAAVASFTDAELLVGSTVRYSDFLGDGDADWINTAIASFNDPAQLWAARSAPPRRDIADIQADGGPREQQISLELVSWDAQAQRVAEITRRFGRLWGRGQVVLPPRFAGIEEGDWITWQSDRYLNGATATFRVEAWGSDQAWHHAIVLRQISASVFSDTAPLADGTVALAPPVPPTVAAPSPGSWQMAAGAISAGPVSTPALIITGASDDPAAGLVRFEYFPGTDLPGVGESWIDAGASAADVLRREIQVAPESFYFAAVSYSVDGVAGDRLILGPVLTGAVTPEPGNLTTVDMVFPVSPADGDVYIAPDGQSFVFKVFAPVIGGFLPVLDGFVPVIGGWQLTNTQPVVTRSISGLAEMVIDYDSAGTTVTSVLPVQGQFKVTASDVGDLTNGVVWSAVTQLSGSQLVTDIWEAAVPSISGTGAGVLEINSGLKVAEATVLVTATLAGVSVPSFAAKVRKVVAAPAQSGGSGGSGDFTSASMGGAFVNSASFAPVGPTLTLTTTDGTVDLTAPLSIIPQTSTGIQGPVDVQAKWQHETSPGVWADIGTSASSDPDPDVEFDVELDRNLGVSGSITINRQATGIPTGSPQNFRLSARNQAGTRKHTFMGMVSAQG